MGPHSVENLLLHIIENHFTDPKNLKKSCWTKPIPVTVAVARPVPIVTARSADVPAVRKAAITVLVLGASRTYLAARTESTKIIPKYKTKMKKLTRFYNCYDKKIF